VCGPACVYRGRAWCATGRRDGDGTTTNTALDVPCELRAAGLMVPEGSMMPFPITPFDKGATCCSEYIPGVSGVAEVQGSSVHVSELQPRPVLGGAARGGRWRARLQGRRTRGGLRRGESMRWRWTLVGLGLV
jgi:hypothetical protein